MYTELVMALELKVDTPLEIITVLKHLLEPFSIGRPNVNNPHPLFETEHFNFILTGDSYYLPGTTTSNLEYDETSRKYYLTVRSNFKNYHDEIHKFLHWIAPFSQTGTFTPAKNGYPPTGPGRNFVGYFCFEEDNKPTLIYMQDGKAYLAEVELSELKAIEF